MKLSLYLLSLLIASGSLFAQTYTPHLAIRQAVTAGAVSEQKATQTIVATNQVNLGATARYLAGQSVTLQPGFVAQAGSVFTATVSPVVSVQPTSDVSGLSIRAYPNPFVEQTTVEYHLPLSGSVRHTLTDAKGQVLRQTEEVTEQAAGSHQTKIDGSTLPEGIYLYQLQVGSESRVLRLIKKP